MVADVSAVKIAMVRQNKNWSGNLTYSAREWVVPQSLEHIQETVATASRVKAMGTRHAFSSVADTSGVFLAMEGWNRVLEIDSVRQQVTVQAGIRYGDLAGQLEAQGWAIPNLASLPHISVMGACATGTHGSGSNLGCLATQVVGMKWVMPNGELKTVDRESNPDEFAGMVVHLGALGVVAEITLDLIPTYSVAQQVFENLPFDTVFNHLPEIFQGAYSVSLFTDWRKPRFTQVWRKQKVSTPGSRDLTPDGEWWGAIHARESRHPLPSLSSKHCTEQGGIPGPWFERLPHFRLDFIPSFGEELQTEYLLPQNRAGEALQKLQALGDSIAPPLLISEIRTVREDDLWMSPHFGRPTVGLHFTWKKDWAAVEPVLRKIEASLAPLEPRPHWGKLSTLDLGRVREFYPKGKAFRDLANRTDPERKFRNDYLDTLLS